MRTRITIVGTITHGVENDLFRENQKSKMSMKYLIKFINSVSSFEDFKVLRLHDSWIRCEFGDWLVNFSFLKIICLPRLGVRFRPDEEIM